MYILLMVNTQKGVIETIEFTHEYQAKEAKDRIVMVFGRELHCFVFEK